MMQKCDAKKKPHLKKNENISQRGWEGAVANVVALLNTSVESRKAFITTTYTSADIEFFYYAYTR
jgi:hypothetical protein